MVAPVEPMQAAFERRDVEWSDLDAPQGQAPEEGSRRFYRADVIVDKEYSDAPLGCVSQFGGKGLAGAIIAD